MPCEASAGTAAAGSGLLAAPAFVAGATILDVAVARGLDRRAGKVAPIA